MEKAGGNKSIKLIAIEVSDFDSDHYLILAREKDVRNWFYFSVRKPSWIEFGDRLLYYPASQELFQDRGLLLSYRARLDAIPASAAVDLAARLPYLEMYPNESGGVSFIPPQEK
jgi:hypothetical protein